MVGRPISLGCGTQTAQCMLLRIDWGSAGSRLAVQRIWWQRGCKRAGSCHLHFADDEQRRLTVVGHKLCYVQVSFSEPGPGAVPANNTLPRCRQHPAQSGRPAAVAGHVRTVAMGMHRTIDFFEHAEHVFQVAVVQEPDGRVPVILLIRHCARHEQGNSILAVSVTAST